jgi:GAF domain/ANTAR domain
MRRDPPQTPDRVASGDTAAAVRGLVCRSRPRATWQLFASLTNGYGNAEAEGLTSPLSVDSVPVGMTELHALERVLREIVAEGGADSPQRICEACVAALPLDRAALTLMTGADQQEPLWASDEVARELDELQFSLGEGPCVQAFVDRRPVLVADLAERGDARWPVFAAAALRTPVRALFVFPVQAGAITVGVLDLYRDTPGMLEPDDIRGALRAADAAMWTVLEMLDGVSGTDRVDGHRVDGRARGAADGQAPWSELRRLEVYQATGMVLEQMQVTPQAALSALRAHAFAHNQTILEVAREVVVRRLRFDEEKS